MSTITAAYDYMVGVAQSLLPDHKRLPDPYNLVNNSDRHLEKGWGFTIERGRSNRHTDQGSVGVDRDIIFKITRQFISLASDAEKRATTEKQILEDQMLILKRLESDFTLGGLILNTDYDSDTGVEYVIIKDSPYLKIETTISLQYVENL